MGFIKNLFKFNAAKSDEAPNTKITYTENLDFSFVFRSKDKYEIQNLFEQQNRNNVSGDIALIVFDKFKSSLKYPSSVVEEIETFLKNVYFLQNSNPSVSIKTLIQKLEIETKNYYPGKVKTNIEKNISYLQVIIEKPIIFHLVCSMGDIILFIDNGSLALRCFIKQFFETLDSSMFAPFLSRR